MKTGALSKKLGAYASTAGAVLIAAPTVHAALHQTLCTGICHIYNSDGRLINIDNAGESEFKIYTKTYAATGTIRTGVFVKPQTASAVIQTTGGNCCGMGDKVKWHNYGDPGETGPNWDGGLGTLNITEPSCGYFYDRGGVIAVKFKSGSNVYHGWINYRGQDNSGDIVSWGYDDSGDPPAHYPSDPTLVELTSFSAEAGPESVRISWQTASEIDNAGFHIWRSENKDWGYEKITQALIPAEGSPTQAASYHFDDKGVEPGKTYYYKLEDVDTGGHRSYYGPVSVQMSAAIPTLQDGGILLAGAALAGAGVAMLRRRRKDDDE